MRALRQKKATRKHRGTYHLHFWLHSGVWVQSLGLRRLQLIIITIAITLIIFINIITIISIS